MPTPPTNKGRKLPAEPLTAAEVAALLGASSTGRPPASASAPSSGSCTAPGSGRRVTRADAPRRGHRDVYRPGARGQGPQDPNGRIDPHCSALLDRWLDRRRALGLNGRHSVFATYSVGKVGQPLDPRYVRNASARAGAKAGIDKRVHPHGLRHSLAFDLAQRSVPTHVIQAQLGHASLAITDRYAADAHRVTTSCAAGTGTAKSPGRCPRLPERRTGGPRRVSARGRPRRRPDGRPTAPEWSPGCSGEPLRANRAGILDDVPAGPDGGATGAEAFFADLGEEIQEMVLSMEDDLAGPDIPARSTWLRSAGYATAACGPGDRARRTVYSQTPEPGTEHLEPPRERVPGVTYVD